MDQTTKVEQRTAMIKVFRKSEIWKHYLEFRKILETIRSQEVSLKQERYGRMQETIRKYNGQVQVNSQQIDDHRSQINTEGRKLIKGKRNQTRQRLDSTAEETNQEATEPQTVQLTLRQKIQQEQEIREETTKNQVQNNTYAQITTPRSLETARTISSATNFDPDGPATSILKEKKNPLLFGNQVRTPSEERSPTDSQAGTAAPPKHNFADTGFVGDHTKPPGRPPSSGPPMSAELQRIYAAIESADRTEWRVPHVEAEPEDLLAALQTLLRPRPTLTAAAPQATAELTGRTRFPQTVLPPQPVFEVHGITDQPTWSGQPIGKTVSTGAVTDQWQGADGRAAKDRRNKERSEVDRTAQPVRILRRGNDTTVGIEGGVRGAAALPVSEDHVAPVETNNQAEAPDGRKLTPPETAADTVRPASPADRPPPAVLTPPAGAEALSPISPEADTPPSAKAEGAGTANANARSAQDAGKRSRRKRPRRRANDPAIDAATTGSLVSPSQPAVLAGNPYAPLSDLSEESPASPSSKRTPNLSGGRRVLTSRKPKQNEINGRPQRKPVTLGDFLPTGGVTGKQQRHRRQRLTLTLGGIEGNISSRVPQWSTRDQLREMPPLVPDLTLRKRRKRIFAGLRGKVSNHIPTYAPRKPWSSRRPPGGPAATSSPPPLPVRRAACAQLPTNTSQSACPPPPSRFGAPTPRVSPPRKRRATAAITSSAPQAPAVESPPTIPQQTPPGVRRAATAQLVETANVRQASGNSGSRALTAPYSPTDNETARLQLIVEIGGKATIAHAHETDWQWVTNLGLTDLTGDRAVERVVVKAVQRALNLPTVSGRHMRIEPDGHGNHTQQSGSRSTGWDGLDSWEALAAFSQAGGSFRATGRLQGGRESPVEPATPPLIAQVKTLATSSAQTQNLASPQQPSIPHASV